MKLKRELKRLIAFECFNSMVFIALYFYVILSFDKQFSIAVFYPVLCCSIILLQGAAYWGLCLLRIEKKIKRSKNIVKTYTFFRLLNIIGLSLYPVLAYFYTPSPAELFLGIGIFVFAIIENINYFYFRLAYPISQWFKKMAQLKFEKSQIAKEISKNNKI